MTTFSAIGRADFTGNNGTGAITVSGLKVGDVIIWEYYGGVANRNTYSPGYHFESQITVDGQIQQVVGNDLSAVSFSILFFRSS